MRNLPWFGASVLVTLLLTSLAPPLTGGLSGPAAPPGNPPVREVRSYAPSPPHAPPSVSASDRWANVTGGGAPSPRDHVAMAFDPTGNLTLLFGGRSGAGTALNDTWARSNGSWKNLTGDLGVSPPSRWGGAMAFDTAFGAIVLFGGRNGSAYFSDTWAFANMTWVAINSSKSPSPRVTTIAYDLRAPNLVLFGGTFQPDPSSGASTVSYNDTWVLRPSGWGNITSATAPGPTGSGTLVYDAGDSYLLLFGGPAAPGHQWTLWKGKWHQSAASGIPSFDPSTTSISYCSSGGFVLLYATSPPNPGLPLTWAYRSGSWTDLSGALSGAPPGRTNATLADDPGDGASLLFGGLPAGVTSTNETWAFMGVPYRLWFNATPAETDTGLSVVLSDSLDQMQGVGFSYAYQYGRLPLGCLSANQSLLSCVSLSSGSYVVNTTVRRSDGAVVTAATTLQVNLLPMASLTAPITAGDIGQNLTFFGSVVNGTAPYRYGWTFGDGANSSGANTTHVFGAAGTYSVNLTVVDAVGSRSEISLPVVVHAALALQLSANRTPTDVGLPVGFAGLASGGTGPYTLHWQFDDGASGVGSSVAHSFGSSGNHSVTVTGSDAYGMTMSANLSTQVHPRPVASAGGDRSVVDVGQSVQFTSNVTGGFGPYSTVWTFSDGSRSMLASPPHRFSLAGPAWGRVTVVDGAGVSTSAEVNLTIHGLPSATLSISSTSGCLPALNVSAAALVTGGTGTVQLLWSFGDGAGSAGGTTAQHTYEQAGTYAIRVDLEDAEGSQASTTLNFTAAPCHIPPPPSGDSQQPMPVPGGWWSVLGILVAALAISVLGLRSYLRGRTPTEGAPAARATPAAAPSEPWSEDEEPSAPPSGSSP